MRTSKRRINLEFLHRNMPTKVDVDYLTVAALIYPHYYDQSMRVDESIAKTMETIKLLRRAIDEQL